MDNRLLERIQRHKLIAIVRGVGRDKMLKLAEAILIGGIDLIEVTFDQSASDGFETTAQAISAIGKEFGRAVCVGAGTVISAAQVELAADAGAQYIISPNVNTDVIRATRALGLVSIPGALTPTEIVSAYEAGANFIKLFPVSSLGSQYVKAIRAPLSHIPMLGVGGINEQNIPEYLKAGCVGFGVGGNLVNQGWIDAGEYGKISATARALCAAAGR